MRHYRKRLVGYILILLMMCFPACVSNVTLESFDLGDGRFIKVTTGVPDNGLPIYYEMHSNHSLVQRCFIFTKSSEYEELQKLKFKLFSDKSKNIFLLMKEAPEKEQVSVVDFSSGFKYPCCENDYGAYCRTEHNRLIDIIEKDNPELKLERLKIQ